MIVDVLNVRTLALANIPESEDAALEANALAK